MRDKEHKYTFDKKTQKKILRSFDKMFSCKKGYKIKGIKFYLNDIAINKKGGHVIYFFATDGYGKSMNHNRAVSNKLLKKLFKKYRNSFFSEYYLYK